MRRAIAGLVGLFYCIAAADMLLSPASWFARIPGVSATGPFNSHLVRDVGFAFLVAGLAFLAFAVCRWPRLWPAALVGSGFPVFHALFHMWGHVAGHGTFLTFELALIALPAALALGVAWPRGDQLEGL